MAKMTTLNFYSNFSKVERFLKSTSLGSLGFTEAEFEDLLKEFGTGDKLISALEEKAQKMNVSLDDVRAHVASLKHQSERACHAHIEWQPPEVWIFIHCITPSLSAEHKSSAF